MTPARIRIGRVKMKTGGADVRVLYRDGHSGILPAHLRAWTDHNLARERPPDAYAAVAFWFDPKTPGRPGYNATYCSTHDGLPSPLIARIAGAYLAQEVPANTGAQRAIEAMGGEPEDWTPDDKA